MRPFAVHVDGDPEGGSLVLAVTAGKILTAHPKTGVLRLSRPEDCTVTGVFFDALETWSTHFQPKHDH